MTVIAIPHSYTAHLDSANKIDLPAEADVSLPIRIIMNGQVLALDTFIRHGQTINYVGSENITGQYFEVDYYSSVTLNLDPDTPASKKPELPELELYSILPSTPADTTEFQQEANDLLLGMVDYSEYDLLLAESGDLATDAALRSAIIMSVYTDAWVDGKKGWWGDTFSSNRPVAASKLWSLMGKRTTPENVQQGIRFVAEATQWLIDDQHFSQIDVKGEHQRHAIDWFAFQLTCHRAGKEPLTLTL